MVVGGWLFVNLMRMTVWVPDGHLEFEQLPRVQYVREGSVGGGRRQDTGPERECAWVPTSRSTLQ